MATIYVVTRGCYSDYRIDACFSTKELANKYIEKCKECYQYNDFNDVEEYIVDDPVHTQCVIRPYWEVTIDLTNGNIANYDVNNKEYTSEEFFPLTATQQLIQFNYVNKLHSVKSYICVEHAQKLAAEQRQEFLRCYPPHLWEIGQWHIRLTF